MLLRSGCSWMSRLRRTRIPSLVLLDRPVATAPNFPGRGRASSALGSWTDAAGKDGRVRRWRGGRPRVGGCGTGRCPWVAAPGGSGAHKAGEMATERPAHLFPSGAGFPHWSRHGCASSASQVPGVGAVPVVSVGRRKEKSRREVGQGCRRHLHGR